MAKKRTLIWHPHCLLLLLSISSSFLFQPSSGATSPDDLSVMQTLAKSLNPPPKGWISGSDPCDDKWSGVTCETGKITSISLASKGLSGTLPPDFNKLTSLRRLSLQNNDLSGDLPTFSNLSNLEEIYLNDNSFQSIPPTFFSGLTSLLNVSLERNPLTPWSIPDDLSKSALTVFLAMNASINGTIPDFLGTMTNLETLRLSYNQLSGGLPPSFKESNIQFLYLNNQKLTGRLDVIGSMGSIVEAWLHANAFTGPIPDLSNCKSLSNLQLRDNSLTGVVPSSLVGLPNLHNLTLANNALQGPMPDISSEVWTDKDKPGYSFCKNLPGPCDPVVNSLLLVAEGFGYPAKIAQAWQGNDPCGTKWNYVVCDPQGEITGLNFASQQFGGTISPAIANFTLLKNLILSDDNLTGPIPDSLTGLTQLKLIDVSNNNLTGKIPNFRQNVGLRSSGNPLLGLDTAPGQSSAGPGGSNVTGSSPAGSPPDTSHSRSGGWIGAIAVAIVVFVCLVGSIYYWFCIRKRTGKLGKVETQSPPNGSEMVKISMMGLKANGGIGSELQSQSSGEPGNAHLVEAEGMIMSIQALLQATENFSEKHILGRGGFGVVYKGELPDGTLIAVKRMECNEMSKKGMTEFQAEIAVLTKVRHRHLVALLGYCMDNSERLLVYEYMPQGTLGQHLFDGDEECCPSLTWKQRLTIALDVARGLEYLHSLAQKSFIHRDLKPSNILLDNSMRAKVSDFGLVKLAPDGKYSVETRLAGTFGYLAPEYATTGRVTTKVDVYAFGVVLMELITGRKALDESLPDESTHLVTWFRRVLINKNDIQKAVDPKLDLDEEDLSSVSVVAELAGHCTVRESQQRPDMGHAVNVLAPLVDQWKPSSSHDEDNFSIGQNESLSQRLKRWQQNEGTSMIGFDIDSHSEGIENTQSSIPARLDVYPDAR